MKRKGTIRILSLAILIMIFAWGCEEEDVPAPVHFYTLSLAVSPGEGGSVDGAGKYEEGEKVNIIATAGESYEFINWAGDTEHIDNPRSDSAIVTIPAEDIALIAVFKISIDYGDGVSDIDGNRYATVIIGNMEWMAENLRTTRYDDGTDIPAGLSDSEWESTEQGAYAVFPHDNVDGVESEEEMVNAYGKLYNWHAVDDNRGLCPEGWRVPAHDEWAELLNYLMDKYDLSNDVDDIEGVGNVLKSCRQVKSPLGGDCDTDEHPRWNSHDTHYGTDEFGFSVIPGGCRSFSGGFYGFGNLGYFWSSTEYSPITAWSRSIGRGNGNVSQYYLLKELGFSVRCLKQFR